MFWLWARRSRSRQVKRGLARTLAVRAPPDEITEPFGGRIQSNMTGSHGKYLTLNLKIHSNPNALALGFSLRHFLHPPGKINMQKCIAVLQYDGLAAGVTD